MNGMLLFFSKPRQFGFVEADGRQYFAHRDSFLSTHVCCLRPGANVRFEIDKEATRPDENRQRVKNIELTYAPNFPEREISTITHWHKTYGWAERDECGCEVYVPSSKIITTGLDQLAPGFQIEHSTVLQDRGPVAVEVEIFQQ